MKKCQVLVEVCFGKAFCGFEFLTNGPIMWHGLLQTAPPDDFRPRVKILRDLQEAGSGCWPGDGAFCQI